MTLQGKIEQLFEAGMLHLEIPKDAEKVFELLKSINNEDFEKKKIIYSI